MNTTFKMLINPYERIAGYTALGLGLLVALISSVIVYFCNGRFDGVLDLHFVYDVNFYRVLTDQFYNLISLGLIFYLAGILVKGNTFRWVDMLGTVFLARLPFMFAPLVNVGGYFLKYRNLKNTSPEQINTFVGESLLIVPLSILLLVLVIWYIILLYKAYTISSNVKGWKAIISFVIAIALAEVLSKYLISHFS